MAGNELRRYLRFEYRSGMLQVRLGPANTASGSVWRDAGTAPPAAWDIPGVTWKERLPYQPEAESGVLRVWEGSEE